METITFDSGWRFVENDSEAEKWVFARSDDGHVTAQVAGNGPNPTAFGNFFPQSTIAFAEIEKFLKPLEQMPHFQESWGKFRIECNFEEGAEYLIEERGPRELHTAENVEIFAKLFIACFPVTAHCTDMSQYLYDGFYGFSDDNITYQPYLGSRNYRELVVGVTGIWRKDIARQLHEMTIAQLQIIHEFSSFVTSENLVEAMFEAQGYSGQYDFYRGGFQTLELLQPSVRVRLLKELLKSNRDPREDETLNVEDTFNMLALVGSHKQFRGCKSWKDVHDTAMKLAPTINGDRVVALTESLEKFSDAQFGEYSFEVLTLPNEFVELGDVLNICIGKAGYYFKALRGESYCFKVLRGGVSIGALEVKKMSQPNQWVVLQLQGHGNTKLDDTVDLIRFIVDNLNSSNLEKVLERI